MRKDIPLKYSVNKMELIYKNKVLLINTYNGKVDKMSLQTYEILETILNENLTLDEAKGRFIREEDYQYIQRLCGELLKNEIVMYANSESIKNEFDEISLKLTRKCNLKCIHCCENASTIDDTTRELSSAEWKKVIDVITSYSVQVITITGGEPLSRKDFKEIMVYLKERFHGKVQLLTNGLLINSENVDWLTEVFDFISISIDGCDEELVEQIRGKGVYKKVIETIHLLQKAGASKISLSAILPKSKEAEKRFDELCDKLGVRPIKRFLSYSGRAVENQDKIEKLYDNYITKMHYERINYSVGVQYANSCRACEKKIAIDYYGNVYPCNLLSEDEFILGNVLQDEKTLEKLRNTNGYKNVESLKAFGGSKCYTCPVKCFCWSCAEEYKKLLLNPEAFENYCNRHYIKLMKLIWNEDIVE